MPINIKAEKQFQLRIEGGVLQLPKVHLVPTPANLPHLSKASVKAEGTDDTLAERIQESYIGFDASVRGGEFKLPEPTPFNQQRLYADEAIPADTKITLTVEVVYYDSDADGQPIKDVPRTETTEILLFAGRVPVEITPKELTVVDGGERVRLQLTVPKRPPEMRPAMRLANPEDIPDPDIRREVNSALRRGFALVSKDETEGLETFEAWLHTDLPERAKRYLFYRDAADNPLYIAVRTEIGDYASADHTIRLKSGEIHYPGWAAIDFGTSNSTVTLFDPRQSVAFTGLPKEQEARLRKLMSSWLLQTPSEAAPGASEAEWWDMLSAMPVARDGREVHEQLAEILRNGEADDVHGLIRSIEIAMSNKSEVFRKAVSNRLRDIYEEAFRVPPLEALHLYPVELDGVRQANDIPSEMELLGREVGKLNVLMGFRARQNRNEAIRKASEAEIAGINQRFFQSPKRTFGSNKVMARAIGANSDPITSNDLMQAAWDHLLILTDESRGRHQGMYSDGRISRVCITYPTVSPPQVREEAERLVRELGITDVRTDYDEAVSAAIFYMMREFGGSVDVGLGLESFKARSQRVLDQDGNVSNWFQNVLVFDIGGGTTDCALIRIKMEEIDPFDPEEDRGLGGRCYRITPELLGASGHLQLGGELVSLHMYRLVKVAIADGVMSAIVKRQMQNDKMLTLMSKLPSKFLDKDRRFKPGSLLACVDNVEAQSAAYDEDYIQALDVAEQIVPTRWADSPQLLRSFYAIWEHAEAAKIHLGKSETSTAYDIRPEQVGAILKAAGYHSSSNRGQLPRINIDRLMFERAVMPVVTEALGIAHGLLSLLPQSEMGEQEELDWLILSGKTCGNYVVQREMRKLFSRDERFVWTPDTVTFVPEYAKLATSMGACYAERLRQLSFDPAGTKDDLKRGVSQVHFQIRNLSFFLPCSFRLEGAASNEGDTIFEAGAEFLKLDAENIGKIRGPWRYIQLKSTVMRQDYDGATMQLWGHFDGGKLASDLNLRDDQWRRQIKVQFQIDQKLRIDMMLCNGTPQHIAEGDYLDIYQKMEGATGGDLYADEEEAASLPYDIAINVHDVERLGYNAPADVLYRHGTPLEANFHVSHGNEDEVVKGFIGEPVRLIEEDPEGERPTELLLWARRPESEWEELGVLPIPSHDSEIPLQHRIVVDADGKLRLVAGEVGYWHSSDKKVLVNNPGCVYFTELELQPRKIDEDRDPFCGRH